MFAATAAVRYALAGQAPFVVLTTAVLSAPRPNWRRCGQWPVPTSTTDCGKPPQHSRLTGACRSVLAHAVLGTIDFATSSDPAKVAKTLEKSTDGVDISPCCRSPDACFPRLADNTSITPEQLHDAARPARQVFQHRRAECRPCLDRACPAVAACPLLITFDDGYRDNFEAAWPALLQRSLPATLFVATGQIGAKRAFWWDLVADAFARSPLTGSGSAAPGPASARVPTITGSFCCASGSSPPGACQLTDGGSRPGTPNA